jgi:long-chain acyl-CoA synthetase
VATADDAREHTAGRALSGTEVRISESGEIEVASPGVMDGYHARRAETEAVLAQGWLRTGDSGVLDRDGRLRVLGRHV